MFSIASYLFLRLFPSHVGGGVGVGEKKASVTAVPDQTKGR